MVHPHSNLVRVIDNINITTDALAAITGVVGPSKIDASRKQGFRSVMQRGILQLHNSDGSGGPIAVYLIEPGLSLAEAEEAIENDPQGSQETPENEITTRKLWLLGFIQRDASGGGSEWTPFSKKHGITVIEGSTLNYLAYNTSLGVAMDAANFVSIYCEHLGVWLRD